MPYPKGNQWKKIAVAFGRAVEDPSATKRGRDMVFKSKTVKDRYGDTQISGFDTDEQKSFKAGMYQGREASDLTYDQRNIPDEAKRVWEAYSYDFERAYGPDAAYQKAIRDAGVDPDYLPRNSDDFKEWFGFALDDTKVPKYKPGYKKAWEEQSTSYSDANMTGEVQNMIDRGAQQAEHAGRMHSMRDGTIRDDKVDEFISDDAGEQYVEEFKRRLRESGIADALRWASDEYIKYK